MHFERGSWPLRLRYRGNIFLNAVLAPCRSGYGTAAPYKTLKKLLSIPTRDFIIQTSSTFSERERKYLAKSNSV
jgi:hypothetical protein